MNYDRGKVFSRVGFGLILAWTYSETRQLKYAIILHMLINFTGGVLPMALSGSEIGTMILGAIAIILMVTGIIVAIIKLNNQVKSTELLISDEIEEPMKLGGVFINAGMITYIIVCVLMMVLIQLAM